MVERILVIGANGQIGSELVGALELRHGPGNVIAADIDPCSRFDAACYEKLDVLDRAGVIRIVDRHDVAQVYQLAALLSVKGEQAPLRTWSLNMDGLLNILEMARERADAGTPLRVFWPSSVAVFGPHTPPRDTPQHTVMDPTTIYGISKQAGERWCEYYFTRYGVDVRSIRYPGIISHRSPPGGGTTDYAVALFHAARRNEPYVCYLEPDTVLPMIYMPDAIRAVIELMETPADRIRIRSAYNVAGLSFSPQQLVQAIRRCLPQFKVSYQPDNRQAIANSWPHTLDDTHAQADWGWRASFSLEQMVADMLLHIEAPPRKLHHAA
jgi:nucleoside-diphosphate-sugar epimerase